jgi:hypothetical protein
VALGLAAFAPVDEHLLAVSPVEETDRLHQRAAVAEPIARERAIDVPREEAKRAMIAVAPTGQRRSDEGLAPPALELLAPVRFAYRLATVVPRFITMLSPPDPVIPVYVVVRPLTCVHPGHVDFLPRTRLRA